MIVADPAGAALREIARNLWKPTLNLLNRGSWVERVLRCRLRDK